MNAFFAWALVISAIVSFVGTWAYTLDVIRGEIGRYTTWAELTVDQFVHALMGIGGGITFILALIGGVLSKG